MGRNKNIISFRFGLAAELCNSAVERKLPNLMQEQASQTSSEANVNTWDPNDDYLNDQSKEPLG